jgi:hypothetical protein
MDRDQHGTGSEHDEASEHKHDDAPAERGPAGATAPPGNPETDEAAVEKGEEQLGRIAGR